MQNNPLVSISCLTFNHAKFIKKCLDGFLMQKCDFNYEVVIYDDASTDGTSEIIKEYAERYPEIFFPIIQDENQYSKGVRGISMRYTFPVCRGKYIAMCDGDDYWIDSCKLQKQVDFLEENPSFILTFTDRKVIDINNKYIETKDVVDTSRKTEFTNEDMPLFCPTLTRLFRNITIPIPVRDVPGGDTYLMMYLTKFGKVKYLDFISSVYRETDQGVYSGLKEIERKKFSILTLSRCLYLCDKNLVTKILDVLFFDLLKLKLESVEGYSSVIEEFKYDVNEVIKKQSTMYIRIKIRIVLSLLDNSFIYKRYFLYEKLRYNVLKWKTV